jgi:signal peptidase I
MSVHSNGRQRSAVSIGQPSDATAAESLLAFQDDNPNIATALGATSRSKRGPDYRLRGLDLGAQKKKNQAPVFPVRRDQPRRRHRRRLVVGWVIVLVIAAAVAMVLRGTIIQPFSVPSAGMTPTLQVNDRILVVKSNTLAGPIQRGDIIVFRRPQNYSCGASAGTGDDLVQRVIGVPGQNIWSIGYSIYVDGRQVDDRYGLDSNVGRAVPKSIPLTTVPAGEYFVVGDNLSQSCDSRSFGSIPASSVVGKVVSIVLRGGHPYIHIF